jgi:hypothetical protein
MAILDHAGVEGELIVVKGGTAIGAGIGTPANTQMMAAFLGRMDTT